MENNTYHHQEIDKVLSLFKTSKTGLSKEESLIRLKQYGPNEIPEKRNKHPIFLFFKQFKSVLIYVLLIAALISYFLGHHIDTYVILVVIIINSIAGFLQEYKAEKAIKALKNNLVTKTQVLRDGKQFEIFTSDLVPGDIVVLEEGNRIPADGRLISCKNFKVIESSLTGESFPVEKNTDILPLKVSSSDRSNMVWMGTFCTTGQAMFVVTSTGAKTFLGVIAKGIESIKRGRSHFEKKTDIVAKQMGILALLGALITFLIGYFKYNYPLGEIFIFSTASLVSGIPEGLPAILVIVLAVGANRMAKKKALIKSLPATETLSVTDVIATDKTGTLTQNTMTIKEIAFPNYHVDVSGIGWIPRGNFSIKNKKIKTQNFFDLSKIIKASAICNHARLVNLNNKNNYEIKGDPTEGALTVLAYKAGFSRNHESLKIIDELPFDQELRYKKVISSFNGKKETFVSGAPEDVFKICSHHLEGKQIKKNNKNYHSHLSSQIDELSQKGMRIIGLAYKKYEQKDNLKKPSNMIFIGLVAMSDPPRVGVKDAIFKAKNAGIRIIMKTGDFKGTAIAIAKEIGIIDTNQQNNNYPEALTGEELFALPQDKFEEMIENVSVFARLTPKMKLDILEVLQKKGHCVAMTGDGVNDALALKKADIGISMGLKGTDVARESSDIVLTDDNFASLVNAIEEGRVVFKNTKQSSAFLITTSFAEDVSIIISMLMGLPLPLTASQLLWLNLVTDGVTNIPLAIEKNHGFVLNQKPNKKDENILCRNMVPFMSVIVLSMTILTLLVYKYMLPFGLDKARTGAFTVMAMCQVFNLFNMRSLELSVFKIGFFSNKSVIYSVIISLILQAFVIYNPFLQNVFKFGHLSLSEFGIIIALSSLVVFVGEIYKQIKLKYAKV